MRLRGRTILITGGTSGIGRALVDQLAPHNALLVPARNPLALGSLRRRYPHLHGYACDLADGPALPGTMKRILDDHPELSVVINCAGVQYTPSFPDPDFDYESIEREVAVNFIAPARICALALPALCRRDEAAVINMGSGLAWFPKRGSAVYSATKAAMHNFSIALRYQLAGTRVSVHESILPLVDTPMTQGRGRRKMSAERAAREVIAGVERGKQQIFVGKARFIPLITRISPTLMARILRAA